MYSILANGRSKTRKRALSILFYQLRYKIIQIILIVLIIIFCLICNINITYYNQNQLQGKLSQLHINDGGIVNNIMKKYRIRNCYRHSKFSSRDLEIFQIDDILSNERKPNKGNSIFFHETSCSKTGQLKLNARQACSIESAALLNPNLDIFVLFASPVVRSYYNQSEYDVNIQKALKLYKNIYYRNVNLWSYAKDTNIYNWFKYALNFKSVNIEYHLSDLLRYITLWRWGGTHLDLDIILKKSLENITSNFVVAESEDYFGTAIINLSYNGCGHAIADGLLRFCKIKFNAGNFNSIGPKVLSYVLQITSCSVTIFEKEAFFAVDWRNASHFFNENYVNEVLSLTKESIGIHVWNRLSANMTVKVGSNVAYGVYAKKYCPKVYSSCGEFF